MLVTVRPGQLRLFRHSILFAPLSLSRIPCRRCSGPRPPFSNPSDGPESHSHATPAADHRDLGASSDLFITSPYSPGSPLFHPNGAALFNRLVDFLRAQYPVYGIREVITPNIYKKALWEASGHWSNYADDMFSVTGRGSIGGSPSRTTNTTTVSPEGEGGPFEASSLTNVDIASIADEMGLKPMNCPGHCLLFASRKRSHRDLPIRFADFSALHRNEASGSLSGLTRLRRFHQDDGHIFCRPAQIGAEIARTLAFIRMAYTRVFKLGAYRLVLSTRPKTGYIGSQDDWDRAEEQLMRVLQESRTDFGVAEGEGAFYGPKIDIIVKDSDGKEHQTATVQLDFQLPSRFGLQYMAKAPEMERRGQETEHLKDAEVGPVTPVLIHRAVLGSVERFIALLLERYANQFPFWLAPHPAIVLTVSQDPEVLAYAHKVAGCLGGADLERAGLHDIGGQLGREELRPQRLGGLRLHVEVDTSAQPLSKKIRKAKSASYNFLIVVGRSDVENGTVTVERHAQSLYDNSWPNKWMAGEDKREMKMEDGRKMFEWLVSEYL